MGILEKIKKTKPDSEAGASVDAGEKKPAGRKGSVAAPTAAPEKHAARGLAYRILLKPLLSEKATHGERHGAYIFMVAKPATKPEIAAAVQAVYGVKPQKVNTVSLEGKEVRFGRRTGRRKGWKKAVVFLPKGKSISIHAGV